MGFTITAAELIAFLASKGFHRETERARHGVKMVKSSLRLPIPAHTGDMKPGTVKDILRKAGYTGSDVMKWRNEQ
ncbi:MAG: type II toxin-antitoxin system HicA family toxin [Synergistaceae bacterium]|jgi:predicted RNA binding protein YcfA (HicA-like mRNA interferase family)|nr:type II toxin-antitoxin system HicA family toxin [Synergistaceae bacterium]